MIHQAVQQNEIFLFYGLRFGLLDIELFEIDIANLQQPAHEPGFLDAFGSEFISGYMGEVGRELESKIPFVRRQIRRRQISRIWNMGRQHAPQASRRDV
jgi:hypothetical protein